MNINEYIVETEREVSVFEKVACFPLDGAVAFYQVLKERFGWTTLKSQKGFFGEIKPAMVGVEIGYQQTTQIPWGRMTVPKIDGFLQTGFCMDANLPCFVINGQVRRKHERLVSEIATDVRKRVKSHSIYRGKAIKLSFRDLDGDRVTDFGPDHCPRFLDPEGLNVRDIVYAEITERSLKTNLFNIIQYSDKCRSLGIPLKRGILLEGTYGTGKTLTADVLAKMCVENGWTFLYLDDIRDLDLTLGIANYYAPCVVFGEDVDKITSGGRTVDMDKLFNAVDGVEGKGREIVTVLTTNSVGNIHPAFLRPGRMDAIIPVLCPDNDAIVKLVEIYGRDKNDAPMIHASSEQIIEAMKPIRGANAAFIREVVEKAKLSAIAHMDGEALIIKAEDLYNAALSMKPQKERLYPNLEEPEIPIDCEEVNPVQFAASLMMDVFMSAFIERIADPKILKSIVFKKMRRPPFGGMN